MGSLALAAAVLVSAPRILPGQGQALKIDPSWMAVHAGESTVEFQLVAGLTPANGGMNFDGANGGVLTLTVPVKWHVTLHFRNDDENMPHSVEVIPGSFSPPVTPGSTPAFAGALSKDASQGVNVGSKQDLHFTANQTGSYLIVCAVPGHGAAGMWIRLVVSASATKPAMDVGPPAP